MPRSVTVSVALVALIFGLGCRPADEIRSYTVPKEKSRAAVAERPTEPREPATPTDRMLVAVVPYGDQATFFKVVGPIPQVEAVAGDVKKFVESLEVSGDKPPTWTLPEGWREGAGNEFRRATLTLPGDGDSLEIAVSELSWQSNDAYLLANVNRWRGQVGLPPIGDAELDESYEKLKINDREAIWLELTGQATGGGMAPFAGSAGGPMSKPTPPAGEPDSSGLPFTQKVPKGWTETPATQFRITAFRVGEGENSAEITVTSFSTERPQMASPLANIDRWRGEVGLPPVDESELAKIAKQVRISGEAGKLVEMESPEDFQPRKATIAAMTLRGDLVWFFKLHGPLETVRAERERFLEWLDSIQFRDTAIEK